MGWGDVSYHRSQIRTPNIDRLVYEGVELVPLRVSDVHAHADIPVDRKALRTFRGPCHGSL